MWKMKYEDVDTTERPSLVPEGALYEWTVKASSVKTTKNGDYYVALELSSSDGGLGLQGAKGWHNLFFAKDASKVWSARFLKATKPALKSFDEGDKGDLERLAGQLTGKKFMARIVHEETADGKYINYRFVEFDGVKGKATPVPDKSEFQDEVPF